MGFCSLFIQWTQPIYITLCLRVSLPSTLQKLCPKTSSVIKIEFGRVKKQAHVSGQVLFNPVMFRKFVSVVCILKCSSVVMKLK